MWREKKHLLLISVYFHSVVLNIVLFVTLLFWLCQMLKYFAAFEIFFEENLPRLFNHFQTNSLTPDLYLIDWWVTDLNYETFLNILKM